MALNAFAKFSASLFDQIIKGLKNKFKPKAKSDFEIHKVKQDSKNKVHPWRSCGVGQHWVTTHKMSVPISSKNPAGLTARHGHCANNPKRKNNSQVRDYLTSDEIHEIANQYFKDLSGPPTPGKLPFEDSDKYDELIRGWTQYWNDVFHPETPLDPDVVKALIASES